MSPHPFSPLRFLIFSLFSSSVTCRHPSCSSHRPYHPLHPYPGVTQVRESPMRIIILISYCLTPCACIKRTPRQLLFGKLIACLFIFCPLEIPKYNTYLIILYFHFLTFSYFARWLVSVDRTEEARQVLTNTR